MSDKRFLVIDTSQPGIKLLLGNSVLQNPILEKIIMNESSSGKQSAQLPTAVEDFLTEQKIKFSDLSAIGIVVGPGSFTGIRLGIAYAKGLSIGLNIPVVPINAFEIYFEKSHDAFVAIDTGRGDFFVAAHDVEPCAMTIDEVETKQMQYPKTIGHISYDLKDSLSVLIKKLSTNEPVIPMYLRPSYAELNCKC